MSNPQYIAPESVNDALKIKQEHGENARVIAGGTDLILRMRDRVYSPELLIDLRHASLDRISIEDEDLQIGAYVNVGQLLEHERIASAFPALAEACRPFAGPPIRNRATIGGNIVNASPAADLVPSLMAYDASVELFSLDRWRTLPLAGFFQGPGQSVLAPDEILLRIRLPFSPDRSAACFIKLGQRQSMAISVVNVCTRLTLDPSGDITAARIVLGAVAPTPVHASAAEAMLHGNPPCQELIRKVARKAAAEVAPITDVRASRDYRLKMTEVLVRRALTTTVVSLEKEQSNG